MKTKLTIVTLLTAVVLVAAGCGGDSSSDNTEDKDAITALVTEINRVSKDRDAQGFCAVMQPSGVIATFDTYGKCVTETTAILKQDRTEQPQLNIEDISIDGDKATVDLSGGASSAPVELVKEDGKWYVPLAVADAGLGTDSGTTDDSGATDE